MLSHFPHKRNKNPEQQARKNAQSPPSLSKEGARKEEETDQLSQTSSSMAGAEGGAGAGGAGGVGGAGEIASITRSLRKGSQAQMMVKLTSIVDQTNEAKGPSVASVP